MSATHVVVEGTLQPDGTLELDSKLNLPPGARAVDRAAAARVAQGRSILANDAADLGGPAAAGLSPRGTEEVETRRRALREDVEEEIEKAGRLQEEEWGRLLS